MRKTLLAVATLAIVGTTIISCGPSAEEIAAREKARQDSIAAVEAASAAAAAAEQARKDSIAAAEAAAAAAEQARQDSIAAAEAAKHKGGKKPAKKDQAKATTR